MIGSDYGKQRATFLRIVHFVTRAGVGVMKIARTKPAPAYVQVAGKNVQIFRTRMDMRRMRSA